MTYSIVTKSNFIDLYHKFRLFGIKKMVSKYLFRESNSIKAKWNNVQEVNDFWMIPEVREWWNEKCTGDKNLDIEAYFVSKYLRGRQGLKMLSIGCGTGAKERRFGKHPTFKVIEGIDIAED